VCSRPPCARARGQADRASLGETRAGKGFTQKRFTEVQALRSDFTQRYAAASSGADAFDRGDAYHLAQALGVTHVEAIIPNKKPRTKRMSTGAKESNDFINLASPPIVTNPLVGPVAEVR
jgi:hypothetical protein